MSHDTRLDPDPEPITTTVAPSIDLATAGRLDAMSELLAVRRAGILYHDKKLRRERPPRDLHEYAESLGRMVFVHTDEPDQIGIRYAADTSKDITIYRHGDWNTQIAYTLAFLAYLKHLGTTGQTCLVKPGTYRLGQMMNDYTNAYVKVFLEDFRK